MTDQLLQRGKKKQANKIKRPRYVLLWERIQAMEQKWAGQEAIHELILRKFVTTVRPLEESITSELTGLTKDLMEYFHKNGDAANRSLLGFWIIENFQVLTAHPFADLDVVQDLYDSWRLPLQGTDDMVEAQLSLLMAGRDDLPGQSKIRSNYPDADMFAAKSPSFRKGRANTHADVQIDDLHDEPLSPDQASASYSEPDNSADTSSEKVAGKKKRRKSVKQAPTNEKLGELFDINRLFRRIARAVHPDREQDDARDDGDIATLLSLYTEHVGELPDTWSDSSTSELVTALEVQLRELEHRSASLQIQNPLLQLILDRYLGYDTHDVERRIESHRDSLTLKIDRLHAQRSELKNKEGFIEALEERKRIELDKLVLADLTS